MTEERKTPDPGAADDRRVSEFYRDVAQERTPEHLDRAVLREVARAARPRYSRLRLWTRPAAWAAVVLLSATLLLQVSQQEVPQDHAMPQSLQLEDRAARRELAAPEADAERQRNDLGSAAKATGTAAPQEKEAVAELLEEAVSQDGDLLIRAEEMARMQQGPNDAPAAPAAAGATSPQAAEVRAYSSLQSREDALPSCDATARATPEDWLACIAALEDGGFTAAAEQERALLTEVFPDFEAP
jgi:hypothetical protein